jgi:hypothetical protein
MAVESAPYSETAEIIKERIAEAERQQRAWGVVVELYQTGKSEQFGQTIEEYEKAHQDWMRDSHPDSRGPSLYRTEIKLKIAKESIHRAFGESGTKSVLDAWREVQQTRFANIIRNNNS